MASETWTICPLQGHSVGYGFDSTGRHDAITVNAGDHTDQAYREVRIRA